MAQAQVMYIGTTGGVVLLSNPGRTDRWLTIGLELADHAIKAVDCTADDPMQATVWGEQTCWQTPDGGQSWQEQPWVEPPVPLKRMHLRGEPPAIVRIHDDAAFLERSEDGEIWQRLALDTMGTWTTVLAPTYHHDQLYAATALGELWYSADRGRTWTRIKRDIQPVTALAIGRVLS